jgi:hypothetical protein
MAVQRIIRRIQVENDLGGRACVTRKRLTNRASTAAGPWMIA